MKFYIVIILTLACVQQCLSRQPVESRLAKCLVCKATVAEMEDAISKEDPKKKIETTGFRLDSSGNSVTRLVQFIRSETYLTDLMEKICDTMDDYAKAHYKKTGRFTLLRMMTREGGMNPEMSEVDFVQDGDLNKSLKHFCLEVLEDNEEPALKLFMQDELPLDLEYQLCTVAAKYCDDTPDAEDYNHEEDETSREEL